MWRFYRYYCVKPKQPNDFFFTFRNNIYFTNNAFEKDFLNTLIGFTFTAWLHYHIQSSPIISNSPTSDMMNCWTDWRQKCSLIGRVLGNRASQHFQESPLSRLLTRDQISQPAGHRRNFEVQKTTSSVLRCVLSQCITRREKFGTPLVLRTTPATRLLEVRSDQVRWRLIVPSCSPSRRSVALTAPPTLPHVMARGRSKTMPNS